MRGCCGLLNIIKVGGNVVVRNFLLIIGAVALFASMAMAQVVPPVYLDHDYGSDAGKISFVNSGGYDWQYGYGGAAELLQADYAELTCAGDPSVSYAALTPKGSLGLPADGPFHIEMRLQSPQSEFIRIYLGDGSSWQSIVSINELFNQSQPHPDTIGDFNQLIPDGGDIAPAGFDGSAWHIYAINVADGIGQISVDGIHLGQIGNGPMGAISENCDLQFGFKHMNVDYVAIDSNPELAPEPATLVLLGFGGLAALRRRR